MIKFSYYKLLVISKAGSDIHRMNNLLALFLQNQWLYKKMKNENNKNRAQKALVEISHITGILYYFDEIEVDI
jgi:hypothetical protein